MDVLNVGKLACPRLTEGLAPIFSELTRIEKPLAVGETNGRITLIPKFTDVSSTQPLLMEQRRLVVLLEWTILGPDGKTIWLQTVRGSSERRLLFVTTKGMNRFADAALQDVVAESVAKISVAPELRKLIPVR